MRKGRLFPKEERAEKRRGVQGDPGFPMATTIGMMMSSSRAAVAGRSCLPAINQKDGKRYQRTPLPQIELETTPRELMRSEETSLLPASARGNQ